MNTSTLAAVGLAVLVLATGAAAADTTATHFGAPDPGRDSGTQAGHPQQTTMTAAGNETESTANGSISVSAETDGSGHAAARDDNGGPPIDMPDAVSDVVAKIHRRIQHFLDVDIDGSLGASIRGLLGHDTAATGHAEG